MTEVTQIAAANMRKLAFTLTCLRWKLDDGMRGGLRNLVGIELSEGGITGEFKEPKSLSECLDAYKLASATAWAIARSDGHAFAATSGIFGTSSHQLPTQGVPGNQKVPSSEYHLSGQ